MVSAAAMYQAMPATTRPHHPAKRSQNSASTPAASSQKRTAGKGRRSGGRGRAQA